jgi:hypothetical protein
MRAGQRDQRTRRKRGGDERAGGASAIEQADRAMSLSFRQQQRFGQMRQVFAEA